MVKSNKEISWALIGSVLIHSMFLIILPKFPDSNKGDGESKVQSGKKNGDSVQVRLLPKETKKQNPVESKGTNPILPAAQIDPVICDKQSKNYEGVGIIYGGGQGSIGRIISAPEYYPAYKAGLRVDDYILNMPLFVVDGYINFEIMRQTDTGTARFFKNIKMEKICYSGSDGAGIDNPAK